MMFSHAKNLPVLGLMDGLAYRMDARSNSAIENMLVSQPGSFHANENKYKNPWPITPPMNVAKAMDKK